VDLSGVDSNNWSKLAAHLSRPQPIGGDKQEPRRYERELWRPVRQAQQRFTSNKELVVVKDYCAGGTTYTLAAKCGCHRNTISRVLKSHGIELANPPIDPSTINEIIRLYETGFSVDATVKMMGILIKTVFNHLRKRGTRTRTSVHRKLRLTAWISRDEGQ